jgi:hypothetical protein
MYQTMVEEGERLESRSKLPSPAAQPPALVDKVIQLVKFTCVAFSNLSLYPATHKTVVEGIQTAFDHLSGILAQHGRLVVSFAGGKLVFSGLALEEKNPTVRKFARHFDTIKVHSLAFESGLVLEEFRKLFELFRVDPATIRKAGFKAMLDQAQIIHIAANTAVYKLLSENEIVVQKGMSFDGKVKDLSAGKGAVESLVEEIISHREGDEHFLRQLRANPKQMAEQIALMIEKIDGDEPGNQEALVRAVLHNIEMVGEYISKQQHGEAGTPKEFAVSLTSLEYELKRKSASLGSKATLQFLKRITEVVSSYSMRAKANVVLTEFLENERSLKSVEVMLKELSPDPGIGKRLLENVRRLVQERNLVADDLIRLIEHDVAKQAKPRKSSRTFKPLAERLRSKLSSALNSLPPTAQEELVVYLDTMFCREIKQAVREATQSFEKELAMHKFLAFKTSRALEASGIGVILLDQDGKVRHVQFQDTALDGIELGQPLPSEFEQAVQAIADGTALRYGNISIFGSIRDPEGKLDTILFQSVRSTDPAS